MYHQLLPTHPHSPFSLLPLLLPQSRLLSSFAQTLLFPQCPKYALFPSNLSFALQYNFSRTFFSIVVFQKHHFTFEKFQIPYNRLIIRAQLSFVTFFLLSSTPTSNRPLSNSLELSHTLHVYLSTLPSDEIFILHCSCS